MKIHTYKGLKAVKEIRLVTEEQLMQQLEQIRQQRPKTQVITDRPAQNGDQVVLDYAGFMGEEQFAGGTAEKQTLVLGSGTFIPGFEEQLVGHRPGDQVDVNVTFPTEYHAPELAGKEAVFHCTVHEINQTELYPLDDTFAQAVAGCQTLEEMKGTLRKQMQEYADQVAGGQVRDQLLNALVEQTEDISVTEEQLQAELADAMQGMDQQLQMQGMSLQAYLEYCGKSQEELKTELRPQAENTVKARLALDEVAKLENITVSPEEIEAEYAAFSKECGVPVEQLKEACGEQAIEALRKDVTMKKAIAVLMENAEVTVRQA